MSTLGVVGAGTMGAGIAQLGCLAGWTTLLHDPLPEALARGLERIPRDLRRGAERGRWSAEAAAAAAERLQRADALDALAPCDVVIEAAPESLQLKRELFGALARIVRDDCVLASNTSSIPITAIATAATAPERVVGMHFFNPAPLMRLVEVVAGEASGEAALATARALGEAMDRRVIAAADGPGFLVNRCNRPFGLEALRLVSDGVADVPTVDRIARLGGGFRMGPFELSDLVGVDVGFEVSRSFHELSFGEPRWRPSPLQARTVAAGRLGRKAGRGWYRYDDGPHRPEDPPPPAPEGDGSLVVVAGDLAVAHELTALADQAGFDVRAPDEAGGETPALIVDCGHDPEEGPPLQGGPQALLLAAGSLAALDAGGGCAGFHALPPLRPGGLVEITRGRDTPAGTAAATERFFAACGLHVAWVGDAPGLVLGRIVCQLVNEAAFALQEGVGTPEDVDDGMVLGLNHPRGPLAWGDLIGLDHVLAVLDGLSDELREERYRAAPLLRRHVAEGRLGALVGEGFHRHD